MSYEVLESRKTYEGKIVTITVDKLRMPDGREVMIESTQLEDADMEQIPVTDLTIEPDGSITDNQPQSDYAPSYDREMLLEIPAGVIEEGESGEAAVLRELEEETGKRAGRAEFLCELYPSVGFCTEKIQLFFATELTAGTQKLDADEFVEIEKYTPEEAIAMIHKGEIKDGKTVAALFAWQARKNA